MSRKRKSSSEAYETPTKKSVDDSNVDENGTNLANSLSKSKDSFTRHEKSIKKKTKAKEKKSEISEKIDGPGGENDMNKESPILYKESKAIQIFEEYSKKKKKRKKDKNRSSEINFDLQNEAGRLENTVSNTFGSTSVQNLVDGHVPAEIGSVDTAILKQASVNLGLPLADTAQQDTSATSEKMKKKKKKKDKEKKEKKTKASEEVNHSTPDDSAINYLHLWHSDRGAWKFNKRFQVRLIHNMYNNNKLTDGDFEILLLYLDGMQGKSRDKTRDEAGKIVTEESEANDPVMQERARQVFQMLS
ncbi:chromosome 7 open reading frame 50 [Plakobranchus ocellatus]|uniref:Chromosome 7 open reading frame 50 n=1 Tax=Plakobranchus ocellatus TaxID=259542 RepID=A0AAV3ZNI1_9GAST|nr:chromosome 7 open reading frame 50 [Plakobranchus ocellatus]